MAVNRRDFLVGAGLGAAGVVASRFPGGGVLPVEASVATEGELARARLDPRNWDQVRAQFALDPGWVHLSGLLLSSHPEPVRRSIERHRQGLDANPPHYLYGDAGGLEAEVRRAAAAYMGARAPDVALVHSTTLGLGLLYNGVAITPEQEVLTTTHDHRVTHESLRYRAERTGSRVRRIALYRAPRTASVDEIVGNLARNLRPETRIVAVTWVHSSTGVKLPIRALAQEVARVKAGRSEPDRVLLCVDGVHGFGVENTPVAELGCDFFVAGAHKWLFGPRGTGVVWGDPRVQGAVTPTVPTFTRDDSWGGQMSPGGFHSFEHRWALEDAFAFHRQIGPDRIAARTHELNRQLKEGLAAMAHVTLYTPLSEALSSGIVCFDVRGHTPGQVVARLREQRIIATRTPYAESYARLTPSLLNTPEDVEAALTAVRALARATGHATLDESRRI